MIHVVIMKQIYLVISSRDIANGVIPLIVLNPQLTLLVVVEINLR